MAYGTTLNNELTANLLLPKRKTKHCVACCGANNNS